MKVTLKISKQEKYNGICVIAREAGDKKFYNESVFMHHVKLALIKQGYDVIKKLMYKDGHMVDDHDYYIRDRKGRFGIYDTESAVRPMYEPFNERGEVVLAVSDLRK